MTRTIPHQEADELRAAGLPQTADRYLTLWNEKQTAARLGCSTRKLQADRVLGKGLPFVKIGRSVKYDPRTVEALIQAQTFTSTTQAS